MRRERKREGKEGVGVKGKVSLMVRSRGKGEEGAQKRAYFTDAIKIRKKRNSALTVI